MGKWVHRLLSVDPEDGIGVCAVCGSVDLAWKKGSPRCGIARRDQRESPNRNRPKFNPRNPERKRIGYGLTAREAAAFREGKVCALCNSAENLAIDHCHETGVIRGILCASCNTGLGKLGDSVEGIMKVLVYLQTGPF